MNAYELADEAEMWGKDLLALNMKGGVPVIECARLVRQQADRIAELEKALTQYRIENFIEGEYGQTITLAELRKTDLYKNVRKQLTKPTHPVKQLSDEEIYELWIDAKQTALNTKGGIVELCFARAIIKEITE